MVGGSETSNGRVLCADRRAVGADRVILSAQPPMADGHRHLYHIRDTHFNARGNRIVGEALAGFLRNQLR